MMGSDETIYQLYGEQGVAEKRKCGSLGKWIPALNRCAYPGYGSIKDPEPGEMPQPPIPPQPPEAPVAPADEEIASEMMKRTKSGRNDVRINPEGIAQMGTNMGPR